LRCAMEAAYSALHGGLVPIVVAPTGYGKTQASPEIFKQTLKDGIAEGLIHVAPLRSLVRSIYNKIFKNYGGAYQMHDPHVQEGGDKSPYLLRPLVVTTLDSYTLNMYRIPVLESLKIEQGVSYGHYYPVYTSVLSAVNVFDEAHLYLADEAEDHGVIMETVRALVRFLAEAGTNIIIETATMKPSTIARITQAIIDARRTPVVITLSCSSENLYLERLKERLPEKAQINLVDDSPWIEDNKLNWETRLYPDWENAINNVRELSQNGKVLVVANTVRRALNIYKQLLDSVDGRILLLHGRLASGDRKTVEDAIDSADIIVATQVIEAGVDVNSIAVISEAAPMENLVQRAGRACRSGDALEWCRDHGAFLGIVYEENATGPYDANEVKRTIKAVKEREDKGARIDWRSPCPGSYADSYTSLIAEVDQSRRGRRGYTTLEDLLYRFLVLDGAPDFLDFINRSVNICGLVRNTIMVPVLVDSEGDYVLTSLEWAFKNAKEVLEFENNAPVLVGIPITDGAPVRGAAVKAWSAYNRNRKNCYNILNSFRYDIASVARASKAKVTAYRWAFQAKPHTYQRGLGFDVDLKG